MMLELMGNNIHTAHDGLAAVEAAEQFRPDMILLDIGLPKLNGYDACRRIRAQPWSAGTEIVALTGWGQEEDRRRSKEAGFDHHMVKPVELAALEKLLAAPVRSAYFENAKRTRTLLRVLVAMTGYGEEADRQRSFQAGFGHHLVKPADIRTLQEILATVRVNADSGTVPK